VTSYRIRRAKPEDAARVARVHTLGWRQGFAGLLPEDFLASRVMEPDVWTSRIAEPAPYAVLVAQPPDVAEDASVCGFVAVGPALPPAPTSQRCGQLYAIYVLADVWGAGVGFALHSAAMTALRAAGFIEAVLWHLEGNTRALTFYQRQGWQETSTMQVEELGGVDAWQRLLRLPLG
jgi:GNAT superfamily N-acetyltransferase